VDLFSQIEISLALFPIALYDIPPHLLPSAEQANLKSKIPETLELEPAPSKKPKKKKETGSEGEKKKTNIDRVSDNAYVREVQNVATEDNVSLFSLATYLSCANDQCEVRVGSHRCISLGICCCSSSRSFGIASFSPSSIPQGSRQLSRAARTFLTSLKCRLCRFSRRNGFA